MKCRDYVFLLTSGQLDTARWPLRAQATAHRLMCPHCRAFTRNDRQLSELLREAAQQLPPAPAATAEPR